MNGPVPELTAAALEALVVEVGDLNDVASFCSCSGADDNPH